MKVLINSASGAVTLIEHSQAGLRHRSMAVSACLSGYSSYSLHSVRKQRAGPIIAAGLAKPAETDRGLHGNCPQRNSCLAWILAARA